MIRPRKPSDWITLGVIGALLLLTAVNLVMGSWFEAINAGVMAIAFTMLAIMGHLLDDATATASDTVLMLVSAHDQMVAARKWHDTVCDCGAFEEHVQENVVWTMPPGARVEKMTVSRSADR